MISVHIDGDLIPYKNKDQFHFNQESNSSMSVDSGEPNCYTLSNGYIVFDTKPTSGVADLHFRANLQNSDNVSKSVLIAPVDATTDGVYIDTTIGDLINGKNVKYLEGNVINVMSTLAYNSDGDINTTSPDDPNQEGKITIGSDNDMQPITMNYYTGDDWTNTPSNEYFTRTGIIETSSARSQRRAYQEAKKETPSEIKYRERLEKAKELGDPDLYKKQIQAFRPIVSQGERAIASTTGTAIRQGLENSIIAGEMKSRVNARTLQELSNVAEKIAQYNEEYKDRAELDLERYNMERDSYLRNLAVGNESRPRTSSQLFSTIANFGINQYGGGGLSYDELLQKFNEARAKLNEQGVNG